MCHVSVGAFVERIESRERRDEKRKIEKREAITGKRRERREKRD